MKLGIVVNNDFYGNTENELNAIREEVLEKVLVPYLHVSPNIGPAQFCVQNADYSEETSNFCLVTLDGVSVTNDRSLKDFKNAVEELENIYREIILKSEMKDVELFIVIKLDKVPPDGNMALIESKPCIINESDCQAGCCSCK